MSSKADVFIIESLDWKDEKDNLYEGKFLSQILEFAGKKPRYYYIRTKKELKMILGKFYESDYRYLHLSCHGNSTSLYTTLDEKISFSEFGHIVGPNLEKRRLFISACSAVNEQLAKEMIPRTGCYSLAGPKKNIEFRDAAIFWASFYHLMFKENPGKMSPNTIKTILQNAANMFNVPINYYYKISDQDSFGTKEIKPQSI
ncbi:hypothetical protein [Desulfosporosinus lacus]|uniref:CHAT domain-containing protein n=1 Tax=Desulfosporosinus lacus DSM 15449 TaxID=1121420 RepID=A0A1M5QAS3_9FIRM|nr:hypothetical protein [Desulfosporosinus lacus]SHH11257.1 hypothetical protein SAMN02746098_00199 [Desulfosporosinus lacus DSM 15449]